MDTQKAVPSCTTSNLNKIRNYVSREPGLVYVGERIKEFPVASPHYGKWNQVAWALISPKKETTDPTALAQILKRMYIELGQPEGVITPCVYSSGNVRVGNLSFNREEMGTVEITKGHADAIVSLNERAGDDRLLPLRTSLPWNGKLTFGFEGVNRNTATLRTEEQAKEFRTLYRCTVLSLFPTRGAAEAALQTISLPRDYIVIEPPIRIRKESKAPMALRTGAEP